MKRSKLCIGFLTLFVPVVLSCLMFSDTSALKHEYVGIPYLSPLYPLNYQEYFDCSNSRCVMPSGGFSMPATISYSLMPKFTLKFEGDSYDSSYNSLNLKHSSSILSFDYSGNYNDIYATFNNIPYGQNSTPNPNDYISLSWVLDQVQYLDTSLWNYNTIPSEVTKHRQRSEISDFFHSDSVPLGVLSCDPFGYYYNSTYNGGNGAVCGGLWNTREYVSSQILPYWYSSDGFYLKSKAIDTNTGIHYSNTFSFDNLFNNYIPKFSYLNIPLYDYDGYFWDYNELQKDRQITFGGSFEFDGSFAWHENINTNGSYFRIHYYGYTDVPDSNDQVKTMQGDINCTTNLVTIEGLTRLDYSCPWTYDYNYNIIGFSLEISGNGNYVWLTDDTWRFASTYIITDNDDTPGRSFNSHLTGGGKIPGDASNQFNSDDVDWFSSLSGVFIFDFFNPFAPIFQMFSDNNSCAQIPVLASMIHSEETQVCPWFNSTTRNIVTPVLGLASMMLVFGFAVRWLGSSSGNLFEDSDQHDISSNSTLRSKWRKK